LVPALPLSIIYPITLRPACGDPVIGIPRDQVLGLDPVKSGHPQSRILFGLRCGISKREERSMGSLPELYFPPAELILDFDDPVGQRLSQPIAGDQPLQPSAIGPGSIFLDLFLADMIIKSLPGS
jgi:hypothetical protein